MHRSLIALATLCCACPSTPAPSNGELVEKLRTSRPDEQVERLRDSTSKPTGATNLPLPAETTVRTEDGVSLTLTAIATAPSIRNSRVVVTSSDGFIRLSTKLENAGKKSFEISISDCRLRLGETVIPVAKDAELALGIPPKVVSIWAGETAELGFAFEGNGEILKPGLTFELAGANGQPVLRLGLR